LNGMSVRQAEPEAAEVDQHRAREGAPMPDLVASTDLNLPHTLNFPGGYQTDLRNSRDTGTKRPKPLLGRCPGADSRVAHGDDR
jgi:hypothetical protein